MTTPLSSQETDAAVIAALLSERELSYIYVYVIHIVYTHKQRCAFLWCVWCGQIVKYNVLDCGLNVYPRPSHGLIGPKCIQAACQQIPLGELTHMCTLI